MKKKKKSTEKKLLIDKLLENKLFIAVCLILLIYFYAKHSTILNADSIFWIEFLIVSVIILPLLYFRVYKRGFYTAEDKKPKWLFISLNTVIVFAILVFATLPVSFAFDVLAEQQSKKSPVEYFECNVKHSSGGRSVGRHNILFTFKETQYGRMINFRKLGGFKGYNYEKLGEEYVYCIEVRKSIFDTYVVEIEYLKKKK